ncbi:hypothetical protein OS347_000731 [Vibrio vulnificus]|nr:hypothetical protein [Vibrio vulnificus]
MNNEITINNKGQEVDCWGRVKYISPTGIVSWYFPCDLPKKAAYTMKDQTREHKKRISESLRTHAIWEHYDALYNRWIQLGMPSGYMFGKVIKVEYAHVEDINRFRFDNMTKNFQLDYEESMSPDAIRAELENVALERMTNYEPKHKYVDNKASSNQGNWWDDCYNDDDSSDIFIGFQTY